jgi:ribosomal protein S18 acetylase RimI-like enzyme
MGLVVRRATAADVGLVAPLFDAYRQFYGQAPDLPRAEAFLRERLTRDESVVFVARADGAALGFVQLYPSFSSMSASPIWVLNDLFVTPQARGRGVGRALMGRAREHALATGARRLVLATAKTNAKAKALYESLGYEREEGFDHYRLELGGPPHHSV